MLEVSPSHSESVSVTLWRGGLPWFDLGSLGIPCKEQSKNIESLLRRYFSTQLTPSTDITELITKCNTEFGWHMLYLSPTTTLRCVGGAATERLQYPQ